MPAFKPRKPNQRKPVAHPGAAPTAAENKKLQAILKAAKGKKK